MYSTRDWESKTIEITNIQFAHILCKDIYQDEQLFIKPLILLFWLFFNCLLPICHSRWTHWQNEDRCFEAYAKYFLLNRRDNSIQTPSQQYSNHCLDDAEPCFNESNMSMRVKRFKFIYIGRVCSCCVIFLPESDSIVDPWQTYKIMTA